MSLHDLSAQVTSLRNEVAQLQEQLSRSQQHNRLVLDSAFDYAVITADASGRITDWSEGAFLIFGWNKEEMLGQSLQQIFTPEDRADGVPEREIGGAVSRGRADDDRWHLRADGQRFWASGV
ncbi:PAS domain S-box protein (plasmid) [Pseudomonas sp. HR96]|uniref:PAS domain S-box protein n=1 Tax=Pseudomonas sp. HR96 TaxID=1027966 RepID=UPI002A753328|nr:PAS domain S-box protein [Pseudomonas sp. HR96]WPP02459.1 PAS domain S-box protein [Pseudomonas sp. HR96]